MAETMESEIGLQVLQTLQGMRGDLTRLTEQVQEQTRRVDKLEGWMERMATELMQTRAEFQQLHVEVTQLRIDVRMHLVQLRTDLQQTRTELHAVRTQVQ